jgi:hypothetical protein
MREETVTILEGGVVTTIRMHLIVESSFRNKKSKAISQQLSDGVQELRAFSRLSRLMLERKLLQLNDFLAALDG